MVFQWLKYKHNWFLAKIENNFPPWPFLSTTICILRCIGKDWRGIELDMSLFVFQGNILIFFVLRRSSPTFRIEDSIGSPCKVIYPKYSKYWPYLLAATTSAQPDITSSPKVRRIFKIRTVRKPDVFLPDVRLFTLLKIEKKIQKKIFKFIFQFIFSNFFYNFFLVVYLV